jgi:5-methylcytosine-specific restriction endonuclease McrA
VIERAVDVARAAALLVPWISAYFVARAFFNTWSGILWLFLFGWLIVLPYAATLVVEKLSDRPLRRRKGLLAGRIIALAEERQRQINNRQAFYASAEWRLIRQQLIEEQGSTCAECGRSITRQADVTVDHKHPRSKRPELGLNRENLRVVCRQCNSRKGARDWTE